MRIKYQRMFQAVSLLIISCIFFWGCSFLNDYQDSGELELAGLKSPVKVMRDEKGMAYIYAQNTDDAMMTQGFVTAQDRLFQMELTKLFTQGRICELAGEKARALDIRMRTIGFYRNAVIQASILEPKTQRLLQKYLDGVNAYIENRKDTHHLEFKLAGIKPTKWTQADAMAIAFYLSWNSAANLKTEIVAQMLVDSIGLEKASTILPLNINPDESPKSLSQSIVPTVDPTPIGIAEKPDLLAYMEQGPMQIGSNNWVVGPAKAAGNAAVVANDPHLDARILPGPWYPCALVTPDIRVVGVGFPGFCGMLVFRSDHVSVGVTNSYGDAQDLYVETVDPQNPDHYLEGDTSIPFTVLEEKLSIKDKKASNGIRQETIQIRLTHRGPIVSDVFPKLQTSKVLTLRWAPFETMQPRIGLDRLMFAQSIEDIRGTLRDVNFVMLNFVFADKKGHIGWQTSGKLPVRSQKDGTFPYVVKGTQDNWTGWIPFDDMPSAYDPEKGWVGTCNHTAVGRDYPYYYSSYASPSYRYRRLKQLIETPNLKTTQDHWRYQRDTLNLMAKVISPLMATALSRHANTQDMAQYLTQWDYHDDPDQVAPTLFQAIYREFARLTFIDELGQTPSETMLDTWYFWQERLQQMIVENKSVWFDDISTKDVVETRDAIFHQAAQKAAEKLKNEFGKDLDKWLWGKVHTIEYLSPIRREGFGKGLLGGGEHPAGGSAETLLRNYYAFNKPFKVIISDSLRMVADLADTEKILAVLPGGVSGRLFHPHTKDQIKAFISGEKVYWWFSDKAIQAHTQTTLVLNP